MTGRRFARREDLGLTPAEFAVLRRLDSPRKIQAFLYGLGQNFELKGDTCRPVRVVLRTRTAHCIEGAMLAACALWIQGEPPLLLDMRARRDYDHVITLFRRNGAVGRVLQDQRHRPALPRPGVPHPARARACRTCTNTPTRREIKTLREYSGPGDLRRFDPKLWVSGGEELLGGARVARRAAALPGAAHPPVRGPAAARPVREARRGDAAIPAAEALLAKLARLKKKRKK